MAANSKSTQEIVSLGKRVIKQIWTVNNSSRFAPASASASSTAARRASHSSAYDKNLDDHVHPSVVPDDVIQPESDKYWAPHPQTGVFGPANEHNSVASVERGFSTSPVTGDHNTELEEKAWFRPTSLEDLEKPHHS